jgi:hypothetical protein
MSHITRSEVEPPDEDVDVTFGNTGSRFGNPRDEIEESSLHEAAEYQLDITTKFSRSSMRRSMVTRTSRPGPRHMPR